ncbi:hypothetical protein Tco_1126418 [Tanacetum coccineum]
MRTKPGVDSLSFDDMYNNLIVFENDVKGSTASSSSTQNVAFVSENTNSTNDVSTAYGVSNSSDLEQLDEFDLEEMDLKWQVAMISMRMKKFYKKTGRKLQFDAKEPVGFDKTKDGRRSGKQEDSKALVTIDGEGVDWTSHSEEEKDYALIACNSSGSNTEDYPHRALQNKGIVNSGCSSTETPELMSEPVVNESNVACQPKVWSDAPIIEEYESDSEDEALQNKGIVEKWMFQTHGLKQGPTLTEYKTLLVAQLAFVRKIKLPDANQVLLRIPRQNNMYSHQFIDIVPSGGLACLKLQRPQLKEY